MCAALCMPTCATLWFYHVVCDCARCCFAMHCMRLCYMLLLYALYADVPFHACSLCCVCCALHMHREYTMLLCWSVYSAMLAGILCYASRSHPQRVGGQQHPHTMLLCWPIYSAMLVDHILVLCSYDGQ